MNYYVVFQNQSFTKEYELGILWAPQKDSSGGNAKFHWENMLSLKTGDIVFSIVSNRIKARSVVVKESITAHNPLKNDQWTTNGWLAEVKYEISFSDFFLKDNIDNFRHMLPDKYSPIRKSNGYGNQGYLYSISKELGEYFENQIKDDFIRLFNNEDSTSVFETDLETSEIIRKVFEEEGIEKGEVILVETERPVGSNLPKNKRTTYTGRKIDFIKKAKRDSAFGQLAEEMVIVYEKAYLRGKKLDELANKVKWVANERDGFGFDVLSYNEDGTEKYIEVKGTTLKMTTPFDISSNEVKTSFEKQENYWIYRVYDLDTSNPGFYKINGSVKDEFDLVPTSYKAYYKA